MPRSRHHASTHLVHTHNAVRSVHRVGGLGFYNCGPASGASQPRRHTQFIPFDALRATYPAGWAAASGGADVPVEAALRELRGRADYAHLPGEVFRLDALPFPHAVLMLGGDVASAPADAAGAQLHAWYVKALLSLYSPSTIRPVLQRPVVARLAAAAALARERDASVGLADEAATPRSPVTGLPLVSALDAPPHGDADGAMPDHNVLLTPRWMMVVPRARGEWRGVSVNALAFAGLLLARGDARAVLEARGPLDVLRECVGAGGATVV